MLISLLNSHPDISCCFNSTDADVGVFHFHNLEWCWVNDPTIKKILLERDIFNGAVSQMVSPHGHRANGLYTIDQRSLNIAMKRRRLYTELLRPHAGFVLKYEAIAEKGKEVFDWQSDELCDFLEIARCEMFSSMRKMRKMLPRNLEELHA
jgi:hypothetical protein